MIDTCAKKLRENDVRETATRKVLLQILHAADAPLSPPEIVSRCHSAGRRANKTTIYRDLVRLEQAGIVQKVIVSDRKQYFELTERGHHHHFICNECEEIADVIIDEKSIMEKATRIGERIGFTIAAHAMEFYGTCRRCVK